jgi:hypothetical protein
MGGATISGRAFSLWDLFHQATYDIDYYQREYAWSAEDVSTLVGDLCDQFEEARQDPRTRRGIYNADPYFLGPFVYYEQKQGARFLVDGQQRFTTVHLLFMHLQRQARVLGHDNAVAKLDRVIRDSHAGGWRFRIDISERKEALQALADGREYEPRQGASLSLRNLCIRSDEIAQLLDARLGAEDVPKFTDWLLNRVLLVGIEAPSRDSGFKIFESMNDRGARLTPVDLLKSFLLSRVGEDEEDLNKRWRAMLAELTPDRDDPGAPSRFLKAALVGHHARLSTDFTDLKEINSSLHLWVRNHARDQLMLRDPNNYFDFVEQLIELAKIYRTFQAASRTVDQIHGLQAICFNNINGLSNQMPFILAAVRSRDTPTSAKTKGKLVSNFIDRWYVLRVLADEPALARDLDDLMPALIPKLRKCESPADVAACLSTEMPDDGDFAAVKTFGLRGNNSAQVRYLLARLTSYAETGWGATNLISDYLSTDRPWQIEHIFANRQERHPEVSDSVEFRLLRNRLGVLGLLKSSVNMSLQDTALPKKVEVYRSENLLLRCLHQGFRQNNKAIREFIDTNGVKQFLRPLPPDGSLAEAVDIRQELYRRLCEQVWRLDRLGLHSVKSVSADVAGYDVTASHSAAPHVGSSSQHEIRKVVTRPTDVQKMVRAGILSAGMALVGVADGQEVVAYIEPDGTFKLKTGEVIRKADDAGRAVTGKRCEGMKFWHVTRPDGARISLRELRSQASRY